ncbi:hypothetical protein NHH03_23520 [Stieleria sp. TO1_6]|nr:hypothetical protein [Stieleria tagensis]
MKTFILLLLAFGLSGKCYAQGGGCVRYVVPHNLVRVCETAYPITCKTGQTYQCGNPETHATCLAKSWMYRGPDYSQEEKEQRDANFGEEGRVPDDANFTTYVCFQEGDCHCRWADTFWACGGDKVDDLLAETTVDWVDLSATPCFGS